jgi:hypothetical protein
MSEHSACTVDSWNIVTALMQSTNAYNATSGENTVVLVSHPVSATAAPLLARGSESRTSVAIKCGLFSFVSIIGFIGNGTALATIRKTPKLRTKTYALLASLTVSDLLVGSTLYWFIASLMLMEIYSGNPCAYITKVAAFAGPQRYAAAVTMMHVCLVSVERYIAIVHPLHYEAWVTDTVIKIIVAIGWIVPIIPCSFYFMQITRINWSTCTVVASVLQMATTDICYIVSITCAIIVLNSSILFSALRQRAKINAQVGDILISQNIYFALKSIRKVLILPPAGFRRI